MSEKSKLVKIFIVLLLSCLVLLITSTLRFEFLWFDQFNLTDIIIKKWTLQFATIGITSVVMLLLLIWQSRWIKFEFIQSNDNISSLIDGSRYTLRLFTCISFQILITHYLLALLSKIFLSEDNNFYLSYELLQSIFDPKLLLISLPICTLFLFRRGLYYINLVFGCLIILIAYKSWEVWALALFIEDSGVKEEVFGSDVTFALGQFPAYVLMLCLLIIFLSNTVVSSYLFHLTRFNRISDWYSPRLSVGLRNHLRPLVFILLVFISSLFWLSRHQFLWSTDSIVSGADWLDIHFNIPLRSLASLIILLSAFSYLFHSKFLLSKIRIYSFLLTLSFFIIEYIISPLGDWLFVRPRELALERTYIDRSIKSTRKAFKLDSIKSYSINPNSQLQKGDLLSSEESLKNIRLWDTQPLLDTNRQLQQLRIFYRFSSVAIDRYRINNSEESQQVMITARELDQKQIPENAKTWLNQHFVFTHGYGFTLSSINNKAVDGLPKYFIKNVGSSTEINGDSSVRISKEDVLRTFPIGRPAIYYGLLPSTYVIAPSKLQEIDYPEGDKNIFNNYKGEGGISLGTLLNRVISSIYLMEPRLLSSGSIADHSRLLFRREVRNRVKTVAPFLDIIDEPYLVTIPNKEINPKFPDHQTNYFWVVDAYTSASTYPYSSKVPNGKNIRYIRNSVKALVDVYNGDISMYVSEANDPIIKAWMRVFPGLFKSIEYMPLSVKSHLRVPKQMLDIQVQKLLRYHVTDPRAFYNGDDIWQVPMELYGKKEVPVEPYSFTAKLPFSDKSEFLFLQPLSPLGRPTLSALLAARNDFDNYGELVLLKFPSQTTIFGPEQVQALINQNPQISEQFTLWDRSGSEVIQGNLLVFPIGNSLLYVEPVYLKASKGGLPTLTKVVVSDGKKISMEDNLEEAISKIVSE